MRKDGQSYEEALEERAYRSVGNKWGGIKFNAQFKKVRAVKR